MTHPAVTGRRSPLKVRYSPRLRVGRSTISRSGVSWRIGRGLRLFFPWRSK